jgi:P27 family predicted phage terminase small subunit
MKPTYPLTDNGKKIFKELEGLLSDVLHDLDAHNLTTLANAFDLESRAWSNINFPTDENQADGVQKTPNGYTQVTGHITVLEKSRKIINDLGAKFGLTPQDREKIKAFSEKPEEDDLKKLLAKK